MTYDNFISVYSMTFDLEECVQTVYGYGLHSLNASLYDQSISIRKCKNYTFTLTTEHFVLT